MADEETLSVRVVADIARLTGGLAEASGAVKGFTADATGAFGGLREAVENLTAPILAFTGLLAGGKAFKEAIEGTKEFDLEVQKLSRTLGVSVGDASGLAIALDDLFLSTETYARGADMLSKRLATGGEGFARYGIATRDASGEFRPLQAIMQDTLGKLAEMKEGTDRNVAGAQLFGKSWAEVAPLVALTSEKLEEGRKRADELHVTLTNEGRAALLRYRSAMNDVGDVTQGFKAIIAENLMPVLSTLGEWFSDLGPGALDIFDTTLRGISASVVTLVGAFELGLITIKGTLLGMTTMLGGFGQAIKALATGDVEGAKAAWKSAFTETATVGEAMATELAEKYAALDAQIKRITDPDRRASSKVGGGGDGSADTSKPGTAGKGEKSDVIAAFEQELRDRRDLEANYFTWSKQSELAFWQEKLAQDNLAGEDQVKIVRKVAELKREVAQEEAKNGARLAKEAIKNELDAVDGVRKAWEEWQGKLRKDAEIEGRTLDKLFGGVKASWDTALTGMLSGSMTFGQAFGNIWLGMGNAVNRIIVQMLDAFLASEAKQLAVFLANQIKKVTGAAAGAGANAAASAAETPGIGWAIAIPAGLAVLAGVMALSSSIPSAAGGWDRVPNDTLAAIHKNEMILPASLADRVRSMTEANAAPVGGGDVHLHVSAMDGASVRRFLIENRAEVAAALRSMVEDRVT